MFKGSRFDKFHGYVPLLSMPLSVVLAYFARIEYHLMFIVIPVLLIFLQVGNEYLQSINPEEIKKHGGWAGFKKNSKQDYRNFWLGLFIGAILAAILIGIFTFYSLDMR